MPGKKARRKGSPRKRRAAGRSGARRRRDETTPAGGGADGAPKTYRGRALAEIAFPLGGTGAGSVSLGGRGELRDWEVMNRPAKGFAPKWCFFAVRLEGSGEAEPGAPLFRVLQGPPEGTFVGSGHTAPVDFGDGLPHFAEAEFTGSYPFASVTLSDPGFPLDVTLEAWSPFIPLDDVPTSLPGAVLTYTLTNRAQHTVCGRVFGNLRNFAGSAAKGGRGPGAAARTNEARSADGLAGLLCTGGAPGGEDADPRTGSLFLGTTAPGAAVWARWSDDYLLKYWEAVAESDGFPPPDGKADIGTVGVPFSLGKGGSASITFLLTWHFPNFEMYWKGGEGAPKPVWKNWYASEWTDAFDAARALAGNMPEWERKTRAFRDALFGSTVPAEVVDAVSANLSTLKTNTCVRLPDGTFYGWEGCHDSAGCCEGSCAHVWNYAQALAFLFPSLQRSMLEAHFDYGMVEGDSDLGGHVDFRRPLPPGRGVPPGEKATGGFLPCADGQMGLVVQVYREWMLGAGDEWLREVWPKTKKALEFAWKYWDADRDGVMEGMQHNTYDIEFHGANSLMGTLYLAALRAGERIARHLGETASAEEYARLAESGAEKLDRETWNGEYYEQKVNVKAREAWPEKYRRMGDRGLDDRFPDWPRWQYGAGCISDQVMGAWLARVAGLGEVLDPDHVRGALGSIFRHNWRERLSDHACTWRIYAQREEGGLLVASWPRGGRPGYPFFYFDECWPGIEYQVASHMIYEGSVEKGRVGEGLVEKGLAIVRACRERFTSGRRNPWDEFECGHHYARSLASYGVLTALSGFSCSAPEKRLGFAPRLGADDFRCFFSSGTAWGVYSQRCTASGCAVGVEVRGGRLELAGLDLASPRKPGKKTPKASASVAGERVEASAETDGEAVRVRFDPALSLGDPPAGGEGDSLDLRVRT